MKLINFINEKINKQNIYVDPEIKTGNFTINYINNASIIFNNISLQSNTLTINPLNNTNKINNNQVITFQYWIKTVNNENIQTINIDSSISTIDDMPNQLEGNLIHVFIRRFYKDSNNNSHQIINYAYSF